MRTVCIVFLFLGLGLSNNLGIADQVATASDHQGLDEKMMPPGDVDQRHLETAAEKRKREQRRNGGDGGDDESGPSATTAPGNKGGDSTFGEATLKKIFTKPPKREIDKPVDNGDDGGITRRKDFFDGFDTRPLTKEQQRNQAKIHKAFFDEQKARVVDKVSRTVGDRVANRVQKRLDDIGCNRRTLREGSDSRNLRVVKLAEDSKANDDEAETRRLEDSNEERTKRLNALQKLQRVKDAINKKIDDEVAKAREDLEC